MKTERAQCNVLLRVMMSEVRPFTQINLCHFWQSGYKRNINLYETAIYGMIICFFQAQCLLSLSYVYADKSLAYIIGFL